MTVVSFSPKRMLFGIIAAIATIFVLASASSIVEQVDAGKIVIKQAVGSGELTAWTTSGLKFQNFGTITRYEKSNQLWFSAKETDGSPVDDGVKITFNDAGTAQVSGSVRFDLPEEPASLFALHSKYGSMTAIKNELVRTALEKAIFASGPLMSSSESYAEKRSMLMAIIEDQAKNGIYATTTKDVKAVDEITGESKTVTVTERIADPASPGGWLRQEQSPIAEFGIRIYAMAINDIAYDERVQAQIEQKRKITMDVQTAIANAKKAEQDKLTTERQGEAEAAKSKWAQEVVKAQRVTEAEQEKAVAELNAKRELEVARLNREAAEETKKATILLAEGESKAAQMKLQADGALGLKLQAYTQVMRNFSEAIAARKVPATVIVSGGAGASGTGSDSEVSNLLNMMQAKVAKDLAVDMSMK